MSPFATHLEIAIQEQGITQAFLAERSGLTQAAISQLVSGDREPTLSTLLKICSALSVTPNDLLAFHSEKHVQMKNEICQLKRKIDRAIELLDS